MSMLRGMLRRRRATPADDRRLTPDVGHLALVVHAATPVSSRAVLLDLRDADGVTLPPFEAGAHIDLHIERGLVRQYSLVGSDDDASRYLVCVQRDDAGRGGSIAVHDRVRAGAPVRVSPPRSISGQVIACRE